MDKYNQAVQKIISEQQLVIGPLAVDLARQTGGVEILPSNNINIIGDPKIAINNLVLQYQQIFGRTSVEVSKNAIKRAGVTFSTEELPEILR